MRVRFVNSAARSLIGCFLLSVTALISPAHATDAHELERLDLQAFFDAVVPYALARGDIAGGVVGVVHKDRIILSKAYGFSDAATFKPMTPQSIIRAGSISKLFVWTAVMQLAGQSKLDLDSDVNDYLDFRIPEKFGRPITLRQLMTHTSGFEDTVKNIYFLQAADFPSLERYVKSNLPARLFPPGSTVAYSNYGAALAGYIVQRAGKIPFAVYIEHNILQPLGMSHSTFEQPLPIHLADLMSRGSMRASDGQPLPFELIAAAPAGGFSTTGDDMTHFMVSQLSGGAFEGRSVLTPNEITEMHQHQHSIVPGMNGFALGFYEESRNGHPIIGHGGDTLAFHSDIHLILDAEVGFFLAFNSAGDDDAAEKAREYIFRAFLDRYFPAPVSPSAVVSNHAPKVAAVLGHYLISRRHESSFLKLTNLLNQFALQRNFDGTVSFDLFRDDSGALKRWQEVNPFEFQQVGALDRMVFVPDSAGRVRTMTSDAYLPVFEFQPAPIQVNTSIIGPLLGFIVLIFAGGLAIPISGRLHRWHFGILPDWPLRFKRTASISLAACALNLLVLGCWSALLIVTAGLSPILHSSFDPWLMALYGTGAVAIVLNLAVFYKAFLTWSVPQRGLFAKIGDASIALASACLIWFFLTFHLISFGLRY